jgi:uncharacterized membrane protein
LLGPIVPTNQTAAALIHAVAVTSASRDGARLAGLSSYYATTSTVEGATRFYWTERSGQVSLGSASGIDIGLYDAPKVSADGSATFGCLVRTRANGPNSTITYPYTFYRWTTTSGYVPFGPSPELANGQIDHVSDDGTVALGLASLTQGGEYRPFRWTLADGYQELEDLPGWPPMSNYLALSRDGRVILALSSPATTFLWSDSKAVTIPSLPGHTGCVANLLSGDGSVVFGTCAAPTSQSAGTSAIQKFRWTATTGTVAIGAASNQLFVTTTADGTVAMGNGDGALSRWTAGGGLVTVQPPDTVFSTTDYWLSMTATSLSEDGSAVYGAMGPRAASTEPGDSGTESFRWSTRDGFVRLRPLPGDDVSTIASASADGSVHTGLSRAGRRGKARAVLWDRLGPRDIAAELTAAGISLDGVELLEGSMVWSGPLIMVVGTAASAGGSRAWIAWLPAR